MSGFIGTLTVLMNAKDWVRQNMSSTLYITSLLCNNIWKITFKWLNVICQISFAHINTIRIRNDHIFIEVRLESLYPLRERLARQFNISSSTCSLASVTNYSPETSGIIRHFFGSSFFLDYFSLGLYPSKNHPDMKIYC